jgi:hypothetical protein
MKELKKLSKDLLNAPKNVLSVKTRSTRKLKYGIVLDVLSLITWVV